MTSVLNASLSLLLGLALAAYGLVHTLTRCPDAATVARLADAAPSLGAALLFAAGVAAAAAGVALLVASLRRLRLAWRRLRRASEPRPSPAGRPHDAYNGNGYRDDADEREWAGAYR